MPARTATWSAAAPAWPATCSASTTSPSRWRRARASLRDAAGYTMVKKNWFNGVAMPAIAVKELDGHTRVVREFGYQDYVDSLG